MKLLIVLIVAFSLLGAGCLPYKIKTLPTQSATTSTQALPKGAVIIYVQDGCPHCAIVESKIRNGLVDKKISVTFKDVSSDMDNTRDMLAKAQACGVFEANFGAPLLWDGQSCYVGQDEILKYIDLRMKEFNK